MAVNLTPKQEAFCLHFHEFGNASDAYRHAYNAQNMKPETVNRKAKELLDNGKIAARLQELYAPALKKAEVTSERIVAELARIAFGSARSVMAWDASGMRLRNSAELTEDEAALVSEVRETTTKDGGSMALKTHDKMKALELLGKHLGMFDKKQEDQSGDDDSGVLVVPGIISEEEWLAATKK